ncbi:MAG: type II toxin-antitoxin system YafQ family toxin [Lachnospiraceae bacterium]|nr:type II toxin-antitoxin system YafQ family toxin [Lachnospiraceae bacterium]
MSDKYEKYKYKVKWTSRFKKDYKLAMKRGYDISLIDAVILMIAKGDQQQKLIDDYDDHELSGDWKGHRELHILPDWLLIYYTEDDTLVLNLSRTGTHSDLFKK